MAIGGLSGVGDSGVKTAGASAQLLPANASRTGLRIQVDPAATAPVYLLLGAGVASATNFHVALSPGETWDGSIGASGLWGDVVQFFSSAAGKVSVLEG